MRVLLAKLALFLISLCSGAPRETRNSQASCLTPWESTGSCIPLTECNNLLKVSMLENLKPNARYGFLSKFYCDVGESQQYCCDNKDDAEYYYNQILSYTLDVSNHNNRKLLNEDICGKWVISKRNDSYFEYPWMALLFYRNDHSETMKILCAGSIINNRYVLTAAHCVIKTPEYNILRGVRVGVKYRLNIRDCTKEETDVNLCLDSQDIYIENSEYHPQFSRDTLKNDVALLRLEKNIDFTQGNAVPICLPLESAAAMPERTVLIAGWGITETGPQNMKLFDVLLSLVPNAECARKYKGFRNIEVGKKQMCLLQDNQKKCVGDNGGSLQNLVNYNGEDRFVQYGIMNFGYSDCNAETDKSYPIVYTRVDYYMDWILDTIRE